MQQRVSISGPSGGALAPRVSISAPVYVTPPVTPAVMHDGTMNTASAEHQKTRITADGQAVDFSSPFAFSQGEGEKAAVQSGPRRSLTSQVVYQEVQQVQIPPPMNSAPSQQYHQLGSFGLDVPNQFQQQQGQPVVVAHMIIQQQQPPPQPQVIYQQVPVPVPVSAPPSQRPQMLPASASGNIIEGVLAKRGEDFGQPWLERFFWLDRNGVLRYSKKKGSEDGKEIPLGYGVQVRPIVHPSASGQGKVQAPKKPFAFEICPGTTGRTYYIDAGSAQKRDVWCAALNEAIAAKHAGAYGSAGCGGGYGYGGYR